MNLQTEHSSIRAVCFSPDKHKQFKSRVEKSSPVKISNFYLKRNKYSSEDEVHINKRSRLSDPHESEIKFDIMQQQDLMEDNTFTSVQQILFDKQQRRVNVQGRINFRGTMETVITKQKTLKKQESFLTDETGSIRLVLWENDILKVQSNKSYKLLKARVRYYDDAPYLTLNMQSIVSQTTLDISREDDEHLMAESEQKTVQMPAEGIQTLTRYLSCNTCKTRVEETNINKVKCSQCGLTQLKKKCSVRLLVKAKFMTEDNEDVLLVLFDEKLKDLYDLNDPTKSFEEITDTDIEDLLLEGQSGTLVYNSKKNVVKIL